MGYSPSAVARSLVTRRTLTIGLVLPSVSGPFLSQVVQGIEEVAWDHGYRVFLCSFYNDPIQERNVLQSFHEHRVDGIIVTSSQLAASYVVLQQQLGIPIVLTNCRQYIYSVSINNLHGGRLAVDYLLQLGHTRIGYIANRDREQANADRMTGYRQALQQRGIAFDPALIALGDGCLEGGKTGMRQLLALNAPPTAVFCYNDMTAIGAAAALREAGLRVPEDISLMGFDDIDWAAYFNPPLTTIRQPRRELGRRAMRMMLELLKGEHQPDKVILPGELIVRGSCRSLAG